MSVVLTGEGRERFFNDAVESLACRAGVGSIDKLSSGASQMLSKPLFAIAADMMQQSGYQVDLYGDRELLAEQAMGMGQVGKRITSFGSNELPIFASSGGPFTRPGDFPSLLSGLANKILDTVELDENYSYTEISALHTSGLRDFKPALMANKSVVEELDELSDGEQFKELGLSEETLSYLFLRRFGNKFGWTPVMVANDDMNSFSEGMIGLRQAWEVTQNRLVLDRLTQNENLLDGFALFDNRPNIGTATNNNARTGGGAPSDTEWGTMESLYADISGINTSKRVRGELNVCLVPTGARYQEARRTFDTLVEPKVADTTANVGLYRGRVKIVPESELRESSATTWYGFRNPTNKQTATLLRAYFTGYGTQGRRESWYDPETKCYYVSLEGRIAVSVKNWRYAVRNAA